MAIHIRDPKTDALIRKLAEIKFVKLTSAVRIAVEREVEREATNPSLLARTADIRRDIASWPKTGLKADKAFYDWLCGQEGD
jgi:antitoxin VapB